jgi:myo-inositol-1(or 4)-monophosphatase
VLATLRECALLVRDSVAEAVDWDVPGGRAEQYHVDLVADAVAVEFLSRAGLDVLSEESGPHIAGNAVTVFVDPIDGSSNAVRGLPWFATSLCAVDRHGAIAAVVLDLTHGTLYDARRGAGARADGRQIHASNCTHLADAYVAYSGSPHEPIPWASGRALGSIALALCYVAAGSLDGFVDFDVDVHGCWDYAGALFICQEASAHATETLGRPLLVAEHAARRSPVVAATEPLLAELALVAKAKASQEAAR